MTAGVDFDFARYIQEKRGSLAQRVREGAMYSYAGERKVRRTLQTARPVQMALEATTRLWRDVARAELLGSSIKVTDQQFPRVHEAGRRAAEALRITKPPAIYAAPASWSMRTRTLGTDDAPYIVINSSLVDQLTDDELTAAIGHQLGHIHNGHILYVTALHYLTQSAIFFVRWIVQPAIMTLQAWSRRAEITADRAALLATKNLDVTLATLIKLELGLDKSAAFNLDDYLKELPNTKQGLGRFAELFRGHPYLPKRVQALKLFAEGSLYASVLGADPTGKDTAEEVDRKVAEILAVF
jgi:Zn-dependent protease with chaperone function